MDLKNIFHTQEQRDEFMLKLLEATDEMIVVFDKDLNILMLNESCEKNFNVKDEAARGKNLFEVFPHVKGSQSHQDLLRALAGETIRNSSKKSSGNKFYIENKLVPLKSAEGEIIAVMVIARNITEQVDSNTAIRKADYKIPEQNEALQDSNDFVNNFLNASKDVIMVLNKEKEFIALNKFAQEILEPYSPVLIGKKIEDVLPHFKSSEAWEKLNDSLAGTASILKEYNWLADEKYWDINFGPLIKKNKVESVMIICHEITDNVKTKKQLEASNLRLRDKIEELQISEERYYSNVEEVQKIADDNLRKQSEILVQKNSDLEKLNNELQSFAYVASHDLQEPLRKIQFFGNLIVQKEADNLSETGKDHFRRMQEATKRMQSLIEDLLSFSRTNDGERIFEKLDLKKIVNEVLSEMRISINEKAAKITVGDMFQVDIIPFQFRQLIQNLISNALKFSNKEGSPQIDIFTSAVKDSEIPKTLPSKNIEYIKLTVKDNGIGFEAEYKERIFDIFQRLHGKHEYKGTGIGLAICKKIAENHNGLIMAEGIPGEGASFIVYLPITQPKN